MQTRSVHPCRRLKPRPGTSALYEDMLDRLFCAQGKFPEVASLNDLYLALAYAVRDRLLQRWIRTAHTYFEKASRTVAYLSAEYLLGPQLGNNLINLRLFEQARRVVRRFGVSLDDLLDHEEEPGLGNGGLGRLAACYLDSLATLEIPAIGYGLRYEFGIFDQEIHDGWQVEVTDKWLRMGNPWEIAHPEIGHPVQLGGRTEAYRDTRGRHRVRWIPHRVIRGTPYDTAVLGYGVNTANILRLWKAEACEALDLKAFNVGDYYRAVEQKVESENITRILYPNDQMEVGKRLRLEQEYFLVSCSLQDMIRIYSQRAKSILNFHGKYAVQLNDTHPALAIAELMRILVDEHELDWDCAWQVASRTFAYTNHTLLPEALEKWTVPLFESVLPRHMEIIFEINRRFLNAVRLEWPGDEGRIERLSIIEEKPEKQVRMANLACVGSFAVNGVSELHTRLLKRTLLSDFHALWPGKFSNKTNGVTPRRFIVLSNPRLTRLISRRIGVSWIRRLEKLKGLERLADDPRFQAEWRGVKFENKRALAAAIGKLTGVDVEPDSMFDVQVKRIHEYKRQHLNVLHAVTLYNRIRKGLVRDMVPRTVIFGGKAAPGYERAKLTIKLINSVAEVVNSDPKCRDLLRIVFFPDFNVKNAQRIYPAADLSEQISTAGREASGTGNMKFAMNGAMTIGTLDGANIEMRQEVGEENFFLFGLTADQVFALKSRGYHPRQVYESNAELREAIDLISSGFFSRGDGELFRPLVELLLDRDEFMALADYESYVKCQERVSRAYRDTVAWTRMSILNAARMGKFSSDRAISEYCRDIWHVAPVHVRL